MKIAVVNAGRVLEGLVRNTFERSDSLRFLMPGELEALLMPVEVWVDEPPAAPENSPSAFTDTEMDKARQDIEALLQSAPPVKTAVPTRRVLRRRLPEFQPDLVLYYVAETGVPAERDVSLLRRALDFRDVPLVLLQETPKAAASKPLLSLGATDVCLFPVTPDVLKPAIEKIMRPAGGSLPVVTKLINPFINASLDMLTTMAGMSVLRSDLYLRKNYRLFGDWSGLMHFRGLMNGTVAVSMSEALVRNAVAKISRLDPAKLSLDDVKDGLGEMVNIISGNAKATLAGTRFGHEIALPTVVQSAGHEIHHPDNAPCIVVGFEADGAPFAVQVSLVVKTADN